MDDEDAQTDPADQYIIEEVRPETQEGWTPLPEGAEPTCLRLILQCSPALAEEQTRLSRRETNGRLGGAGP